MTTQLKIVHYCKATHVETVVLLSQRKPDDVIEVDLDIEEMDITSAETKATYQDIQEYILGKYNKKVHTAHIAEVKEMCGIIERENYNKTKKSREDYEKSIRHCPKDKVVMIKDAFQHFNMI